ncbi:MAG: hypothetical protein J6K04_12910 [Lachnospiraceae bacterium]|nr:hypothetical protein [Lachnospiraceae bacterium]
MIDFISILKENHSVTERNLGDYTLIKKKGMKFHISGYEVKGIGNVSTMQMSAMFGLMKMRMLVFTPLNVDAPLFSYDYINAMGNETLLLELYNTQLTDLDVSALDQVKSNFSALPDHDLGTHWYDHLKLSPSLAKKSKKVTADYQKLCNEFFHTYLTVLAKAPACDRAKKQKKVQEYTNGLLSNGGPSTDQFKNMIGEDATRELFTKYIFSSDC